MFIAEILNQLKGTNKIDLANLPSYRDFSIWYGMDQSFLKTQLDYWKNVYETLPPRLIMPSSKPRTSTLNPYAVSDKQEIDSKLLLQIEDLKRKHALTDYMFYMAVFMFI